MRSLAIAPFSTRVRKQARLACLRYRSGCVGVGDSRPLSSFRRRVCVRFAGEGWRWTEGGGGGKAGLMEGIYIISQALPCVRNMTSLIRAVHE